MSRILHVEPLTKAGFAPYGEVVTLAGCEPLTINQGFARRFNDLATVDVATEGGMTNVSLFCARARRLPLSIIMMERHPLGSQMFFPLQMRPWLVVVCDDPLEPESFRAFAADGAVGVNYGRNIWHFPLITFDDADRFLVVDRKGGGNNLEEVPVPADQQWIITGEGA